MPRFPVNFRRKSTAADDQNGAVVEPSFRVLERPNSGNVKTFDGGAKLSRTAGGAAKTNIHDLAMEDNLFAGLNSSRYVLSLTSLHQSLYISYANMMALAYNLIQYSGTGVARISRLSLRRPMAQ